MSIEVPKKIGLFLGQSAPSPSSCQGIVGSAIPTIDLSQIPYKQELARQIYQETYEQSFRWALQDRRLIANQTHSREPSMEDPVQQAFTFVIDPSSPVTPLMFAQVGIEEAGRTFASHRSVQNRGMKMAGLTDDKNLEIENIQKWIHELGHRRASPLERQRILNELEKMGEKAVEPLVEAIKNETNVVLRYATQLLKQMGYADRIPVTALLEKLNSNRPNIRKNAAVALLILGPDVVDALIDLFKSSAPSIARVGAICVLHQIEDPRVSPILLEALTDHDWLVRMNALEACPREKLTLEILISLLSLNLDRIENGVVLKVVLSIAPALKKKHDLRELKPLIELLSSKFNLISEFGLEGQKTLIILGDPSSIDPLLRARSEYKGHLYIISEEEVIKAIKYGYDDKTTVYLSEKELQGFGDAALEPLACLVDDLEIGQIAKKSLDNLVSLLSKTRPNLLTELLDDSREAIRAYAAEKLCASGRLSERLRVTMLTDSSEKVRCLAVQNMTETMAKQQQIAFLTPLLEHPEDDVRLMARGNLERLKREEAERLLREVQEREARERWAAERPQRELEQKKAEERWLAERLLREAREREAEEQRAAERLQRELEEEKAEEARRKEELKEAVKEKIEEITEAIREKISERLGLELHHKGSATEGNQGHYGSVTLVPGIVQRPEDRIEQRVIFADTIDIEVGDSIDEITERAKTLNFLVHHEIAHLIEKKLKIERPSLDLTSCRHLDKEKAEHYAKEVLIDKLGFDAARKIYVYGDGDILFDEGFREAVAIQAYVSLVTIILRNLKSGAHTLSDENFARLIAVAREMSRSEQIAEKTQQTLKSLANDLYKLVISGKKEEIVKEIALLISKYGEIFRCVSLPQ